jgi:hypothetical protein
VGGVFRAQTIKLQRGHAPSPFGSGSGLGTPNPRTNALRNPHHRSPAGAVWIGWRTFFEPGGGCLTPPPSKIRGVCPHPLPQETPLGLVPWRRRREGFSFGVDVDVAWVAKAHHVGLIEHPGGVRGNGDDVVDGLRQGVAASPTHRVPSAVGPGPAHPPPSLPVPSGPRDQLGEPSASGTEFGDGHDVARVPPPARRPGEVSGWLTGTPSHTHNHGAG